jgi:hypothetical protein
LGSAQLFWRFSPPLTFHPEPLVAKQCNSTKLEHDCALWEEKQASLSSLPTLMMLGLHVYCSTVTIRSSQFTQLNPLDHSCHASTLQHTLPASSGHVVLARFELIRPNRPKCGQRSVQSIRSVLEQSGQNGRDLHLLDHSCHASTLQHTLPASTDHVVLARFHRFELFWPNRRFNFNRHKWSRVPTSTEIHFLTNIE